MATSKTANSLVITTSGYLLVGQQQQTLRPASPTVNGMAQVDKYFPDVLECQ